MFGTTQKKGRLLSVLMAILALSVAGPDAYAQKSQLWQFDKVIRPPFPTLDLGARQSAGQDAIDRLGNHLPDVASWYGRSADQLRKDLLKDRTMRLDKGGRVLFVEELTAADRSELAVSAAQSQSAIQDGALVSLDQTFYLHSHPGATRTIYLDFNGATISNTAWNTTANAATLTAVPYDIDGNQASFSTTELQRIQYIWQRVAEDYAPFDVDVTTEQPVQSILTRSDVNDQVFGTTVVITKTDGVYNCQCGGIAYVGVFNYSGGSNPPDYYKPAFVFYNMLGNGNEKYVSEAISHEAGHNMGLSHDGTWDGTVTDAYYEGQGTGSVTGWAPIMGVGYYRPLVQFSKGEYTNANNKEDDFVQAQKYGLPLRLDDYGSNTTTATPFVQATSGTAVSGSMDGVIEASTDADVFSISAGVGTLEASVLPATRSPNVDIALTLLDASGKPLATANALNELAATLSYPIQSQGTYYLEVKGTGEGNPATTGYSSYGSVGNFRLSANFVAPNGSAPTAVLTATPNSGPTPLAVTLDGTTSVDDGKIAFWYWDFGDGNNDETGSLSSVTHVYQVPGSYLASLTVLDDSGLSSSTTRVINASMPAPLSSVQSIQMSLGRKKKNYFAVGSVTIVDQTGKPVNGASITASWGGIVRNTLVATTSTTGKAIFTSPATRAKGCFNLTITSVAATGYVFNSASPKTGQICR